METLPPVITDLVIGLVICMLMTLWALWCLEDYSPQGTAKPLHPLTKLGLLLVGVLLLCIVYFLIEG